MDRTQIYLTEEEHQALRTTARETGKTQSGLIRLAVDRLIERPSDSVRLTRLRRGRGIWEGREDIPDLRDLRREWERFDGAKG
ncbi:MAG: CopG family transcriptional regulator [Deltaproteobacteria bacterium]|nr:CopG family transcriptional regulator [Deltaproteobacteria bacterium]